jgi:hypothetical protein
MAVCVAFAVLLAKAPRREGCLGKTRLSPIALALQDALAGESLQAGHEDSGGGAGGGASGQQQQADTS